MLEAACATSLLTDSPYRRTLLHLTDAPYFTLPTHFTSRYDALYFTLRRTSRGVQGGTALAQGLVGSRVSSLNLAFNGIGAEGVGTLAAVLGRTEIARLNLMGR